MTRIQVVRRGLETWEITRVSVVDKGSYEYELLARVTKDDALYYVEFVEWHATGYEWKRVPRGYLIPRAAIKFASLGPAKKAVN